MRGIPAMMVVLHQPYTILPEQMGAPFALLLAFAFGLGLTFFPW